MNFEKKKIRGWKRRIRQLEEWKKHYLGLSNETLSLYSRDYVKLWLPPFYSLTNYRLPNWYKKLLINALIEIYDSWNSELEVDKKYYLKIWLFEKEFMQSQVVIATDKFLHFYDNTFEDIHKVNEIPLAIRVSQTKKFNWCVGVTVSMYRESELIELLQEKIYTTKEVSELKAKAYLIQKKNDDTLYFLRDSKVWLGDLR